MTTILDGIEQSFVETDRIRASVLRRTPAGGDVGGAPVVLVHGNVSSSLFWQPLMLALPRPTIAIDLRGFGDSEMLPVDATRGLRDWADDLRHADDTDLVPQQAIELSRDYVSVPTSSAGTEGEREILARELRREMVSSILRRIDAVSRLQQQAPATAP